MNKIYNKQIGVGIVLVLSCLLGTGAIAGQGSGKTKPPATGTRIGQFQLSNPNGIMDFIINQKTKLINWDVRGKNLSVKTARYDMTAPHIIFQQDFRRNAVVTGNATGGVHIVIRQPEEGMVTTADCDSAVYHEAKGPTSPARIDMQGNVKVVNRNPKFTSEDPPVLLAKSGYVEFVDPDNISVHLDDGGLSGTPIEPPAKSGKPQ